MGNNFSNWSNWIFREICNKRIRKGNVKIIAIGRRGKYREFTKK